MNTFNIVIGVAQAQQHEHRNVYNDLEHITIAHSNASSKSRQWPYEATT